MKKAFTLIELLAVIIILAIIALIATPIVLDIIEDSRKSANLSSANMVLSAANNYFAESMLDETKQQNLTGDINLIDSLQLSNKPENGIVYIRNDGRIYISMTYDNSCYYKDFTDNFVEETDDLSKCSIDESEPIITAKIESTKMVKGTNFDLASLFEIEQNGTSSIKKMTCINKSDNNEINDITLIEAGTHEIECTVIKNNGKTASATTKISVIDYGTNISNLYTSIYAGTDKGNLVTGRNNNFSGNFQYAAYIPGNNNVLISKQDTHRGPNGNTYKQNYIYSGQNYYAFARPTSLNRWISIMICGGYLTTGVQIGNLSFKFSDGNTYTLAEAINNKYIQPLAILSSPDSVEDGTSHDDHYFSNASNLVTGGITTIANYPFIYMHIKIGNISQLEGINLYSNKNFNTNYSDGLIVQEVGEGFELSTQPW